MNAMALQRILLFLTLTFVGLWPALWAGGPLIFKDSAGYYRTGGLALEMLENKVFSPQNQSAAPQQTFAAGEEKDTPSALGLRSLPFSVFTNVTMRTIGEYGTILILSALSSGLILMFVAGLPMRAQIPIGVGTVALTLMPFYASQLMPDILASSLILSAMILTLRPDVGKGIVLFLLGVIFFSIVSHYAHIPLALAVCVVLFVTFWRRGMRWKALIMLTPFVLALAVNMGISVLVQITAPEYLKLSDASHTTDERPAISIAPARVPILLARSLSDGAALKYLQDVCPDPRFTMCEVYDEFPSNVGAALWGKNSIKKRATPEQMWRISNEEIPLLWAAFKAYPMQQTQALLGNAWRQFYLIGYPLVDTARTSVSTSIALEIDEFEGFDTGDQRALELVQLFSVLFALLAIAANYRVMPGPMRSVVWLLLLSLTVNAIVCGGLSAPVDRYQGRIIWCVVLLGFTAAAIRPALGLRGQDVAQLRK